MMMKKGCAVHMIAMILLVIGGLNWGLVGVLEFNLVEYLFGAWEWLERAIYILVGLSAIIGLVGCKCKKCMEGCDMKGGMMGDKMMKGDKKMGM